jgi:hypothetical protein
MGATVAVINLQRSSWSDLCYLNFGVLVDALGRPGSIREELCHLRLRAPHPEPRPSLVEAALDPEHPELDNEGRTSILTHLRRPFATAVGKARADPRGS